MPDVIIALLARTFFALILAVTLAETATANPRYAGIVIDARTGKTLYAENADDRRYPASLTKMMTLYLAFEALEAGRIRETTRIAVSRHAASEPPSRIGLRAGGRLTVRDAMLALVTKSANDAATALGEHLAGSEAGFARMATAKARALGMRNTTFRNAHGLPDKRQVTTARDMAILGLALREHFPKRYAIFQTRSFTYGKQVFGNHNHLLRQVKGVDGIKTGFTNASGFNLVTSVRDRGRSIVAVVMGGTSVASRDAQMRNLIGRYLPKAATQGDRDLIARGRGTAAASIVATALPKRGPLPVLRDDRPVQTASLGLMPVPAPRGAAAEVAAVIAAAEAEMPPAAGGWTIQIAAVPAREDAIDLLERVRTRLPAALAEAEPLVVEHRSGGQTVYRARFAGFDSKDSAWQTCGRLKQQGVSCWASEG